MAMKQCDAGLHLYNVDEFDKCPYCQDAGHKTDVYSGGDSSAENKTQPISDNDLEHEIQPMLGASNIGSENVDTRMASPKTTIIGSLDSTAENTEQLPVTGWMVIVNGAGKGKDFRLIQGENKIGRSADMEICLDFGVTSDQTVSRESHAAVVYDNHANEFFVERGKSRNLPILNGKTVKGYQDMKAGDVLTLGETSLMFFPLCGENFKW